MSTSHLASDSNPAPTEHQNSRLSAAWRAVGDLVCKRLLRMQHSALCRGRSALYRPKHSLLRSLSRELYSCYRRILYICKHRPDLHGVRVGKAFQISGDQSVQWDKQTLDCNSDIERFLATRHWLTLIDVELFREAWYSGAESVSRNHHNQRSEIYSA